MSFKQNIGIFTTVQIHSILNRLDTLRKQVRVTNTPYTPLLFSKTGVYKGIHYFLIFALNIDCGYTLEPPH